MNGPLKAHIKGLRAARVFNYFQLFRGLYEAELDKPVVEEREMPKWSCPKPTLHQCIQDLMDLFHNGVFVQHKFKESIRNSFIATGCAADIDGSYRKCYANTNKGSLPIVPTGTKAKTEFPIDEEHFFDLVNLIDGDDEEIGDDGDEIE